MKINHMILVMLTILELQFLISSIEAFYYGEVINFEEADQYNFLFAILNRKHGSKNLSYICTATAISRNVLITAAHCFNNYWKLDPIKEWHNITYYIYPTKHRLNLKKFDEILKESIRIDMNYVKKHPNYLMEVCPAYDIATITIKNRSLIQKTIPLCSDFHAKGKAISLIKRGFQYENITEPHTINYGTFEIENNPNKCDNNSNIRNNDTQFCATPRNSYYTEDGDSGAPLLANTTHPTCIMGVVSCGRRTYTIFSRPIQNDIWKDLFLSQANITTSLNGSNTTSIVIDTTLYYHIVIVIILIVIVSIMCFVLFPKNYTTPTTPTLELKHLTLRELEDVLGS